MLAFCGFTTLAEPVTFQLEVDDASHVKVSVPSTGYVYELTDGENELQIEAYSTLEITGISPWSLDKVHDNVGNSDMSISAGSCRLYPSEGSSYTVTTFNLEASRTATATVKVDDASMVRLMRTSDYQTIELNNGDNTIHFNPEKEQYVQIFSTDYTKPIYAVKLDGKTVTDSYGTYNLTLTNGCVVDITAVIPDIDVTVTFAYSDELSEGCISGVSVNDVPVDDFDGKSLKMKAGQTLVITGNSGYAFDEFKIDGNGTYFYGKYTATIMANTEFTFKAHPYGKIKATIKVDDPSTIIVGKGGYDISSSEIISLNPGTTEIELFENNTNICWAAANGCYIKSVDIDGTDMTGYTYAALNQGSVVTFTAGKIEYDKTAIVWIDNKETADTYFNMQGYDRSTIDIQNGYNEVPFYDGMLPVGMSWFSQNTPVVGKVYINNELQNPAYEGSTTYELSLEDGCVVKVFFAAEPVECAVTFNVAEGVQVAAKADRITGITDLAAPLTVFAGTEITLSGADDSELLVKVNDTEISPAEDGTYTLTVSEPATTIAVDSKIQDSISELTVRANSADAIHDLQGRRVAKAGKGIYIINGKQTLLR